MKRYRRWTKLTVVCHHASHLIVAARVRRGPCNDAPDFAPTVIQAARNLAVDRLLGDAAYDAEAHHRLCREELGMRSTVIPLNHRGAQPHAPPTRYRRQMYARFPKRLYGRRWQVESVFSRLKRLLGPALQARNWASRVRECYYRVLTHDLMILLFPLRRISTKQTDC